MLVTLYAILCVLLVLAVVSIYYASVWGYSRTICRLLFTLGRTWRFLLLTVRLAVGIMAFFQGHHCRRC